MANTLRQVKNFNVHPQILGINAQTYHKIIELTLRTKLNSGTSIAEKVKKFRHCSEESLMRVRNEVARKCKLLRRLRGPKLPIIYNYSVIKKLYQNAKIKCVGYWKGRHKTVPIPMSVKTVQAQVSQTTSLISRELRTATTTRGARSETVQLIEKLKRLEKT